MQKRAIENRRHPAKIVIRKSEDGKEIPTVAGPLINQLASAIETSGFTDFDVAVRVVEQVTSAQPLPDDTYISKMNSATAIMNGIAPETPLEGLLAA